MADWKGDDIDQGSIRDDVAFEPENNEPRGHGDAEHKIEKLKHDIEKIKKERQEYLDGWQRSKADYVNLLKRTEAGGKEAQVRGVVKAVGTLLPAFDALERAKEHGEVPAGFAGIAKQLEGAFAELGLAPIGEVGEQFDPALHEALGQDAAKSATEDDTITAILEKGWKIGENIIRPAKVRVAHYAAQA
jgi:molecular chaperone GrpE